MGAKCSFRAAPPSCNYRLDSCLVMQVSLLCTKYFFAASRFSDLNDAWNSISPEKKWEKVDKLVPFSRPTLAT